MSASVSGIAAVSLLATEGWRTRVYRGGMRLAHCIRKHGPSPAPTMRGA